ncbi:peptidase M4 [Streptomyces sp. SID3343]|nr:peptidase M4 [Streptomyces sp. SID3343]
MTEDQAQRSALVPLARIDYVQAATAASAGTPDAKVIDIELKRATDNTPVWGVRTVGPDGTAHHVEVDAGSGAVRNDRVDADQDAEDKRKLADRLAKTTTTWQQAAGTALARKQGTVTAVEHDDDKPGWSVDIVTTDDWNKTTYDVDAGTGQITREHVDRD